MITLTTPSGFRGGVADVETSMDGVKWRFSTRIRSARDNSFVHFNYPGQYTRLTVTSDEIGKVYQPVVFAPSDTTKALGSLKAVVDPEAAALNYGGSSSNGGSSSSGTTSATVQADTLMLVTHNGTAWSRTKAQVDAARAAGYKMFWVGSATPSASDGLANGDAYNGTVTAGVTDTTQPTNTNTPLTIQAGQAPTRLDPDGTASDTITLTRLTGVKWVVDGTTYAYANFNGASTLTVPYTKGTNTTVTAVAESGYEFTSGSTTSWNLTFTNNVPAPVVPAGGVVTSAAFSGGAATIASGSVVPFDLFSGGSDLSIAATGGPIDITSSGTLKQNAPGRLGDIPYTDQKAVVEFNWIGPGTGNVWYCVLRKSGGASEIGVRFIGNTISGYSTKNFAKTPLNGSYNMTSGDKVKLTLDTSAGTCVVNIAGVDRFTVTGGDTGWSPAVLQTKPDMTTSGLFEIDNLVVSKAAA